MQTERYKQRDMMRKLLIEHGYNERAVCAGYEQAELAGLVSRSSNKSGFNAAGYAQVVWRDGHKPGNPWIIDFCRRHRIDV
jgi:hypothetical protein